MANAKTEYNTHHLHVVDVEMVRGTAVVSGQITCRQCDGVWGPVSTIGNFTIEELKRGMEILEDVIRGIKND